MLRSAVAIVALLMWAAPEPALAFVAGGGRLAQVRAGGSAAVCPSRRQAPLGLSMQLTPQEKTRKTLTALGGLVGFLVLLENVASPLMLKKLAAEKEEKAAKEVGQK
jgi:hypothetical protein